MTEALMTEQDVADYLRVPLETLRHWRKNHGGPRSIKLGRHVRYQRSDIASWLLDQVQEPAPE